jgi:hypothetical protein
MRLATASNYKYTMMVSLQKLRDKVCVLCKAKDYKRSWMIASIAERILAAIPGASQVTLRDARYTSSQDFSAKGLMGVSFYIPRA